MKIIENKYGFFEVAEKLSEQELQQYYSQKYYQEQNGAYSASYTEEEITFFNNKIEQRFQIIQSVRTAKKVGRLLEIGSGEGFVLSYFKNIGWDVLGVDFSEYGCKQNNPHCLENMAFGDLYAEMTKLIDKGEKFDVVLMQNLLEHVTDPEKLLKDIQHLVHDDTVIVITVPNDFSPIQKLLLEQKKVPNEFWVVLPDHLSYFTKKGLENIFDANGYKMLDLISDFPIDLFLLNDHSNYITNKANGSQSHKSRLLFENLLHRLSAEKTNAMYRAMAELEIGRQYTAFVKLK
jgi:2-polyprenyl-3-methyl-5-hydroxy-6-metoxy-1,4-benzoquinol methylase